MDNSFYKSAPCGFRVFCPLDLAVWLLLGRLAALFDALFHLCFSVCNAAATVGVPAGVLLFGSVPDKRGSAGPNASPASAVAVTEHGRVGCGCAV
jgi:hypothetical protein